MRWVFQEEEQQLAEINGNMVPKTRQASPDRPSLCQPTLWTPSLAPEPQIKFGTRSHTDRRRNAEEKLSSLRTCITLRIFRKECPA